MSSPSAPHLLGANFTVVSQKITLHVHQGRWGGGTLSALIYEKVPMFAVCTWLAAATLHNNCGLLLASFPGLPIFQFTLTVVHRSGRATTMLTVQVGAFSLQDSINTQGFSFMPIWGHKSTTWHEP